MWGLVISVIFQMFFENCFSAKIASQQPQETKRNPCACTVTKTGAPPHALVILQVSRLMQFPSIFAVHQSLETAAVDNTLLL